MSSGEIGKSLESEVASYILAYLLQNNFKASASAFLQECDVLPSKTFLVLPETPLQAVIAEHKARLNAKVLVNTLGSEPAWQELWSKVNTTLQQIRSLSEDLNSHHFQPAPRIKVQKIFNGDPVKKSIEQSGEVKTASLSPHKRKQGSCRRIQHTSSSPLSSASKLAVGHEGSGTPNSPTVQQVLDTFLDDDAFPGKLASIINQCVSSGDVCLDEVSSEMSSETLERILNVTLSEPTLEGVLPPLSSPCQSAQMNASELTSLPPCSLSTTDYPGPPLHTSQDHSSKRPKLDNSSTKQAESFPSEQDIDSFLDQIHQ